MDEEGLELIRFYGRKSYDLYFDLYDEASKLYRYPDYDADFRNECCIAVQLGCEKAGLT